MARNRIIRSGIQRVDMGVINPQEPKEVLDNKKAQMEAFNQANVAIYDKLVGRDAEMDERYEESQRRAAEFYKHKKEQEDNEIEKEDV